ncbi:MAG: hypothetical protein JJE09_06645 [Bacteroidia bacterium]|nr:hypothetical protein [Bacteroidia bacterium]
MKGIFLIIQVLLIFILAFSDPCVAAGDALYDSGRIAAKKELRKYLNDLKTSNHLNRIGFKSQNDLNNAIVGEGFRVYTIDPDKIQNDVTNTDYQSVIVSTYAWFFLVVSENEALSILQMGFVDNNWKPGALGSSEIAKAVNNIIKSWPSSDGYQYKYIRDFSISSDFIEISHNDNFVGIVPVPPLIEMIGKEPKEFNASDMLDKNEFTNKTLLQIKQSNAKSINLKR